MAKRGPQLNSVADVSTFMGKIIREVYTGKLDPGTAGRLGYLCNILKGCLDTADIEKRLEELEKLFNVKGAA